MRFNRRASVALPLAVALLATACGGDDEGDAGSSETTDESSATEEDTAGEEATEEDTADDEAPAASGETLLIWADERKVGPLEDIAPAFTEATGVAVEVELVPFDEIRDQVSLAGPAGEGPDIFAGAHDWTGELASNGIIDPIDLGGKAGDFVEVGVNAFGYEGQTFAVPYVTEAIALYYNTDLVSEVPATFDEIAAACESAGTDSCVAMPGGGSAPDAYHNYPFVSGFGATIFAYDAETGSYDPSEVLLDSESALQGGSYLQQQVEAGVVESTDYDTAKNLFLEGSAPFWITGPWELGGTREAGLAFDVAVIPQIGDQPTAPFVGAQGFFVNAFSENKLLAQTFLLDFISTQDTMQALYDADPRGTAWQAVQDGLTDDPQVATFAESAGNGVPMPNVPEMASVWGPLGDNLLLVRNGELGSDEALSTSAEAVRTAVAGG